MTTIDTRDPLATLAHEVKQMRERLDWLEIHVKALQEQIEVIAQYSIDTRHPQK